MLNLTLYCWSLWLLWFVAIHCQQCQHSSRHVGCKCHTQIVHKIPQSCTVMRQSEPHFFVGLVRLIFFQNLISNICICVPKKSVSGAYRYNTGIVRLQGWKDVRLSVLKDHLCHWPSKNWKIVYQVVSLTANRDSRDASASKKFRQPGPLRAERCRHEKCTLPTCTWVQWPKATKTLVIQSTKNGRCI